MKLGYTLIYVDDVPNTMKFYEKSFAKAVKSGAMPVSKPTKKPWGQIVSYVRDCNGVLVEICSEM